SLLSIAQVRPAFILRKDVAAEMKPPRNWRSLIVGGVILGGLWATAVWVGSSVKYATLFAAVLVGSLLVLGLLSAVLLHLIRRLGRHSIVRRSAAFRHGIANLYRPGVHATAILASLGIGVMFTVTIYFLQYSLLEEVRLTAPPNTPNVF